MIVLDSDFLIDFFKGDEKAVNKMAELLQNDEVSTTVINYQEVFFGALGSKDKEKVNEMNLFFQEINILDYKKDYVIKCCEVSHKLRKKGLSIGILDEIIAGICLSVNAKLLTKNKKHFSRVEGLKAISW